MDEFCNKVDALVKEDYDLDDGGSLCFNLLEMEVISIKDGVDVAARVVAQHMLQA